MYFRLLPISLEFLKHKISYFATFDYQKKIIPIRLFHGNGMHTVCVCVCINTCYLKNSRFHFWFQLISANKILNFLFLCMLFEWIGHKIILTKMVNAFANFGIAAYFFSSPISICFNCVERKGGRVCEFFLFFIHLQIIHKSIKWSLYKTSVLCVRVCVCAPHKRHYIWIK